MRFMLILLSNVVFPDHIKQEDDPGTVNVVPEAEGKENRSFVEARCDKSLIQCRVI